MVYSWYGRWRAKEVVITDYDVLVTSCECPCHEEHDVCSSCFRSECDCFRKMSVGLEV